MDEAGIGWTVSHPGGGVRVSLDDLPINRRVTIPAADLRIETSTASGPGGQRVNRVRTRVSLILDFEGCQSFSSEDRHMLRDRLSHRIAADGSIRVTCGRHRRQSANIEEVRQRLAALLQEAIEPIKVRRPTKPSHASKKRRGEAKSRQSDRKRDRGRDWGLEG